MSTLLFTSPRSSPSPGAGAAAASASAARGGGHSIMARHQVAFGQSHPQHININSPGHGQQSSHFGGPSAFPSSKNDAGSGTSSSSSSFGFGFGSGAGTSSNLSSGHAAYGPTSTASTSSAMASTSSSSSLFKLPHYIPSSSTSSSSMSVGTTSMANAGPSMSSNRRRRRRSDSPGDRDMEEQSSQQHHHHHQQQDEHNASTSDSMHLLGGKRFRREIRPVKSMGVLASSSSHHSSVSSSSTAISSGNEVDVGKVLTSLSKPALLSILTSLLATQPALKPIVLSLLPPPSLDTFATALHAAEKRVLDALPVGRNLRDEYVWSRVRAPLEEYISEVRLALGQFCPSSSTGLLSSVGTGADEQSQQHQQQQQHQHPATIFSFLFTLTQSVRKLEALLPRAPLPFGQSSRSTMGTSSSASASGSTSSAPTPSINNPSSLNQNDPLVCFLPALFNQWHVLVTKLSNLVNQNGRVLSAEMVRNWFKQLDALVDVQIPYAAQHGSYSAATSSSAEQPDASSVGRKASEAVRERFIKELGWLVGIRHSSTPGSGIQAVANQLMDSRMMMADSDEEL